MKTFILLTIIQLGSAGADAYYTNRTLSKYHCCELNPIARPFVGSPRGVTFYFSASAAAHIGGAWYLRKHHHNKLANLLLLEGITDHTYCAITSALAYKP